MTSIINPLDPIELQNKKLLAIAEALMNRVENATDRGGAGFTYFQTAISLGEQIKERTYDLEDALEHLNLANAELTATKAEAEAARMHLSNALEAVREGFAVFDNTGSMVMRNRRFCEYLPDVNNAITPPMSYENYVKTVCQSRYLAIETASERAEFQKRRMAAHRRRNVNFTVELKGDRWVQISEQHTPDGGTAILQTEITDTVRFERLERDKQLDAQAMRIKATLDHLNQGVAIFDDQNLLVRSNQRLADLLHPPFDLLRGGTSFSTISDYFTHQKFFLENERLIELSDWVRDRKRKPLTLRLSTVNKQVLDLFCQTMPDQGFVVSLTDVTSQTDAELALTQLNETLEHRVRDRTKALRDARDQAERANATRTRFVAAVSHDLLQPLNAAKLFLAGMKEDPDDDGEAGKLRRAKNALGSVETILGALLDITRLDTAEAGINRNDLPLKPILRSLASEYRQIAESKGIDFKVEFLEATIDSDQTYFRRILQNLISNAIKYTTKGHVHVTAREIGDEVVIKVVDTGQGIPDDQQSAVFGAFVSLPNATIEDPGMGLGLAIVERACSLLGHPLSLVSTVEEGTTFEIRVPLVTSPENTTRQDLYSGINRSPLKGCAALIIENDGETRAALAQLLEGWDIHTFEAADESEARSILSEVDLRPDMILSDYHLDDGSDGIQAITNFREQFGDIPAVLVTADRSKNVEFKAQKIGVTVALKPIDPDNLRAQLEVVASRQMENAETAISH